MRGAIGRMMGAAVLVALGGCVSVPAVLQTPGNGAVASIDPATQPAPVGSTVRWGGTLVAVRPEAQRTCFEVLSRPLWNNGRPKSPSTYVYGDAPDAARMRFAACQPGFVDPQEHPVGHDVTVLGTVTGQRMQMVGAHALSEPTVAVQGVRWWPMARANAYPYGPYPYWWGPYPGWYGPGWGPGWYGGGVWIRGGRVR